MMAIKTRSFNGTEHSRGIARARFRRHKNARHDACANEAETRLPAIDQGDNKSGKRREFLLLLGAGVRARKDEPHHSTHLLSLSARRATSTSYLIDCEANKLTSWLLIISLARVVLPARQLVRY